MLAIAGTPEIVTKWGGGKSWRFIAYPHIKREVRIYVRIILDLSPLMRQYIHTSGRADMERDSKEIVKRLKDEGFELVSVKGSHHKFRKGAIILIVPHPKKDLPFGTVRAIAKDAGWI